MQKLIFLVALLIFAGCQNTEKAVEEKPVETKSVRVRPDTFQSVTTMEGAQTYTIDTAKSRIAWHCENHKGLVDLKQGFIFVRKDEPVGAYAEAITKSARDTSITYKLMKGTFNNVLQTPDFFDGAHYPLLKFKTTDIQKKNGQYAVNGKISIRNVIQPIQFNLASFRKKDDLILLETEEIPINRTLFGMELNSRSFPEKAKDFIFSDTFFVKVVIWANKK